MRRALPLLLLAVILCAAPVRGGGELDEWKDLLEHFDFKERLRAIDGLEDIGGEKAAVAIAAVLGDDDWEVQIRALKALGSMGELEVWPQVARAAVEGEIILVRKAATQALYDMAIPKVYKKLLKAVGKSRETEPKVRALLTAERLADKRNIEHIVPYLNNRDRDIRAAAFLALGFTRSKDVVKYLEKGLNDKEITVRVKSAVALGQLALPECMPGMTDLVLKEIDPYVMERVARGFRRMDPTLAAEYLRDRAKAEKRGDRRARVIQLLGELESEPAGRELIAFLSDSEVNVRAWAARGIGRSGHAAGAEAIEPLVLGDADPTVARMALEGLVRLITDKDRRLTLLSKFALKGGKEIKIRSCVLLKQEKDPAVVRKLLPLIGNEDWRIATAAMMTIGILGHQSEIEPLAARLGDRDWRIRATCLEALGLLRHMDVVPFLIAGLKDPDDIAKSAALKNLQILSQSHEGPNVSRWKKWYEQNKDSLEITKKGYREEIADDEYGKSKYLIEILKKAQIVCVLGKWDHAEIVLEHLGIPTTIITPQKIYDIGLNPKQLMLINCEGSTGKKQNIGRIQWFVHVGGYLMATDWALQNAVVKAFPGYVNRHSKSKTGNDVVIIEAADPDHPLLKGVFTRTTELMWWLEVIAYPMLVEDLFRTEILVDSLEMLQKYYSSPMATVFDFGHGKVETCVSHFYLQEEGLTNRTTSKSRKIFAADNLGISLKQIRILEAKGFFDGQPGEAMTKEIAQDYSMFRLIVNFVVEKRKQVEQE